MNLLTPMKYLSLKDSIVVFFSQQFCLKYKDSNINCEPIWNVTDKLKELTKYEFIDKITYVNSAFSYSLNIDRIIYSLTKEEIYYINSLKQQMLVPYRVFKTKDDPHFIELPPTLTNITAMDWLNSINSMPLSEEPLINKIRFEEFIIDTNKPNTALILCLKNEDVSIHNYCTNNGIPNILCRF